MVHSGRLREPISIDGFFEFLNGIFKSVDVTASFESWHFYKERILYSYEEDELKSELLPISTFGEMLPGSRIFWLGSLKINNVEVKTEVIFNVGADGQTRIESNYAREAKGLPVDEVGNIRKIRRLWRETKELLPIVIPLIGQLIRTLIES